MSSKAATPRGPRAGLIIVTLLYAVALPFLAIGALMSPMASDAGVNPQVWTFIGAMMSWPVAVLLAVILAWIFYAARRRRAMWIALALPLLWLAPVGWSMGMNFGH